MSIFHDDACVHAVIMHRGLFDTINPSNAELSPHILRFSSLLLFTLKFLKKLL